MARDLMVFAPVIPSLKLDVMWELISRTSRLTRISFFWKMLNRITSSGRMLCTMAASLGFMMTMVTIAPTR